MVKKLLVLIMAMIVFPCAAQEDDGNTYRAFVEEVRGVSGKIAETEFRDALFSFCRQLEGVRLDDFNKVQPADVAKNGKSRFFTYKKNGFSAFVDFYDSAHMKGALGFCVKVMMSCSFENDFSCIAYLLNDSEKALLLSFYKKDEKMRYMYLFDKNRDFKIVKVKV